METRPADCRRAPARRDDGITGVSSVAYGFIPDITFAFTGRRA